MQIFHSVAQMQQWSSNEHKAGNTVGFTPTMGALHEGHAHLFSRSVSEQHRTVVSIFVNPLQFNNEADLDAYPRQLEQDIVIAEQQSIDVLFVPSYDEMYPTGFSSTVSAGAIATSMEGLHRPGHFDGVATVVIKLLNAVQPNVAYFGEKDFQQVAVIRQVVRDLNLSCEVASVPTVREPNGLALSSRNARLTPETKIEARQVYSFLQQFVKAIHSDKISTEILRIRFTEEIQTTTSGTVEYIEVVDSKTLQPVLALDAGCTICIAVWFGDVRLIDNISVGQLPD
jgi:pantoate--beta-alanine ligase